MSQLDRVAWKRTCGSIERQARRLRAREGPLPRAAYSDALIARLYFWSVLHDRPLSWAADPDHVHGRMFRPRQIPSRSQLGRRVNGERFTRLVSMVHRDLAGAADPSDGGFLDGKPLTVSPVSKDPQAGRGHIAGGFAKGYKLHVWSTHDRRIPLWSVMPLNAGETVVAEALAAHMPRFTSHALTLADGGYDSGRMYAALAARNGALLAKPRGLDLADPGPWRRHQAQIPEKDKGGGPDRQAAMNLWRSVPWTSLFVYRERITVEATLSNLCSYGGGLGPLPAWVRTLRRVRRWVGAKIILYHARLQARRHLASGV